MAPVETRLLIPFCNRSNPLIRFGEAIRVPRRQIADGREAMAVDQQHGAKVEVAAGGRLAVAGDGDRLMVAAVS